MLEVAGIDVAYGRVPVLRDVSLTARPGEILCILGRNGAGKTTLMKAIMGLLPPSAGRITLDGRVISGLPADRVPGFGLGYVPQGRRLFGALTVAENLTIGRLARAMGPAATEAALARFPRLAERLDQRADTLSGGEQTMLAVARALCLDPSVLLLDEPTEGLQPSMIAAIRAVIVALRDEGRTVLLVEQRIDAVLAVADRVTFLDTGRSGGTLDAAALRAAPGLLAERLGV